MGSCCGGNDKTTNNESCCSVEPTLQVKIDRYLRGMAGVMVLLSAALIHFHSPDWIWLTVFVGANLLQSAFTKWCPAISLLKKILK